MGGFCPGAGTNHVSLFAGLSTVSDVKIYLFSIILLRPQHTCIAPGRHYLTVKMSTTRCKHPPPVLHITTISLTESFGCVYLCGPDLPCTRKSLFSLCHIIPAPVLSFNIIKCVVFLSLIMMLNVETRYPSHH